MIGGPALGAIKFSLNMERAFVTTTTDTENTEYLEAMIQLLGQINH